jgi:ParB family transcriptional regulator, chromosome partitioning protein
MEKGQPLLRTLFGTAPAAGHSGTRDACAQLAAQASTAKAGTVRTLAAVLAAWEQASGVHTWRNPTAWDALMSALTEWGYPPSEVEGLLTASPAADEHVDADDPVDEQINQGEQIDHTEPVTQTERPADPPDGSDRHRSEDTDNTAA